MTKNHMTLGISFIVGLVLFGTILYGSVTRFLSPRSTVVVKGIGEKIVESDYVIWKIAFTARDTTFPKARAQYHKNLKSVKTFLQKQGIHDQEVKINVPTVNIEKSDYGNAPQAEYVIQSNITVESQDIYKIEKASSTAYELLEQDIFLQTEYGANPKYLLRDFDSVRPALLEDAVKSAHKMATRFAEHSGMSVGTLHRANQGNFSIQSVLGDYNEEAYPRKKIRVVSSATYGLE